MRCKEGGNKPSLRARHLMSQIRKEHSFLVAPPCLRSSQSKCYGVVRDKRLRDQLEAAYHGVLAIGGLGIPAYSFSISAR